jgi:hypothetical protein
MTRDFLVSLQKDIINEFSILHEVVLPTLHVLKGINDDINEQLTRCSSM